LDSSAPLRPNQDGLEYRIALDGLLESSLQDLLDTLPSPARVWRRQGAHIGYGDMYAMMILWRRDPAALVGWFDRNWRAAKSDDQLRLRRLDGALHVIAEEVEWGGVGEPAITALFGSTSPVLRWFGHISFEAALRDGRLSSADMDRNTPQMTGDERQQVLCWLIQRASTSQAQLFQALKKALQDRLPVQLDGPAVNRLVETFGRTGTRFGLHQAWIWREFLEPLVIAGRLDLDAVADVWLSEHHRLWDGARKTGTVLFQERDEGPLTKRCAQLLATSTPAFRQTAAANLGRQLSVAERKLQAPLCWSRDWAGCAKEATIALWVEGLARAALWHLNESQLTDASLQALVQRAKPLSRRIKSGPSGMGADDLRALVQTYTNESEDAGG